jgi:type I restriction-modification system DNA methylase subunit
METLFTPEKIQNTINMITGGTNQQLENANNGEANQQLENTNINEDILASNKEALKTKIHSIHNFMRNNGIGYGMNALKVFNIIYGIKKIEDQGLCEKMGIPDDLKFSELLKLGNEQTYMKKEYFVEKIIKHLLDNLAAGPIRNILFYEIPKNFTADVLIQLFNKVNEISIVEKNSNTLLSGKIYEYFIGRDDTAISELGAYFTDRPIVEFIYELVDPKINDDGTVKSMIDMFGGSGGFTTGYVDYLNKKYKINWQKEIKKIYHYDINEDVIKSAALELLCLTGELPDTDSNMRMLNSFTYEFDKKYDFIFTNPPYGGDANKKTNAQKDRIFLKEEIKSILEQLDKIKSANLDNLDNLTKDNLNLANLDSSNLDSYIKSLNDQYEKILSEEREEKKKNDKSRVSVANSSRLIKNYAEVNNIYDREKNDSKIKDKEGVSLLLMMNLLAPNGTACGVLKEGVFFNPKYKDLRKILLNNFNIKEIISVDAKQFENTSVKTSIIIFENTKEKTNNIKFSQLIVKHYKKNTSVFINGKVYIKSREGDIRKLYKKHIYSVSKEEILKNKIISFDYKKYKPLTYTINKDYELKSIADTCEFIKKSNRLASDGQIKGKYNFYTSSYDIKKFDIADYKNECVIVGTGRHPTIKIDKNFSCSADNLLLHSKYNKFIYGSIFGNMRYLIYGAQGSVMPHINREYLEQIKIPFPKSEERLNYWENRISENLSNINKVKKLIEEKEKLIYEKIKKIQETNLCKKLTLKELVKVDYGKLVIKRNCNKGEYPVYGGGDITNYIDMYNREPNTLIISKSGMSETCVRMINTRFYLNMSGISLNYINLYQKNFINYVLLTSEFQNLIYTKAGNQSCQKNLDIELFLNLEMKIPINEEILKDFNLLSDEIEKLQANLIVNQNILNATLKELRDEALPNFAEEDVADIEIDSEDEIDDNKSESSKSSSSKTSSNKSRASKKENVEEVKKVRTGPKKKPKLPGHVSVKHEDTDDEDLDINSDIIVEPAETKIKIANEQNKLTKKIKSKNNITN